MAHFTTNCASLLSFIFHIIAQPFFKLRMPRFLVAKCQMITILFKSHFIFCASHEYNFRSHRTFFPLHVSNVFRFFSYPKLFFCRERAITKSCSNSLLHTWFALHSLTRDGIICLEAEQYQHCFIYCAHPGFSSLNSRKNMHGIFVCIRYFIFLCLWFYFHVLTIFSNFPSHRDVHTLLNVIFLQRNDTEIQFCYVLSIKYWKSKATRSSFFMCLNKHHSININDYWSVIGKLRKLL